MNLYLNELAPWERKKEYYHNLEMGREIRQQTELLSQQTNHFISSQAASAAAANSILISQEKINNGLSELSYDIQDVAEGIYGLKAAFEWGISEITWQIEQNREVLRSILDVLMAPLDTQAKELKRRAEDAYSNKWYDDALIDFLESEKRNRYDFTVHISVGIIYLFNLINRDKALEYFEKAIKYAKPKSPYHASFALLYKGLIFRDKGLLKDAEACASEAVSLSPDFGEAHYQLSQYNAALGNSRESIEALRKAIRIDRCYCLKASNDSMFDPIKSELLKFFESLRSEAIKYCTNEKLKIEKSLDIVENSLRNSASKSGTHIAISDQTIKKSIDEIDRLIERNRYFDAIDAVNVLYDLKDKFRQFAINRSNEIKENINRLNSRIHDFRSTAEKTIDKTSKKAFKIVILTSVIAFVIAFLITTNGLQGLGGALGHLCIVILATILAAFIIGPFALIFLIIGLVEVWDKLSSIPFHGWQSFGIAAGIAVLVGFITSVIKNINAKYVTKNKENDVSSIKEKIDSLSVAYNVVERYNNLENNKIDWI